MNKEGAEMRIYGTTVIGLKKGDSIAMGSDGQVTFGESIVKSTACKVRYLYNDSLIAGFAGSVADAMTLFDRFEEKLEETKGNLFRASVQLAKEWRMDKYLRNLEAMLAVYDTDTGLLISGNGEIIQPDDGIVAIGSGGDYALAAAKALIKNTDLSASEIVEKSLDIAASLCIYTNNHFTIKELKLK